MDEKGRQTLLHGTGSEVRSGRWPGTFTQKNRSARIGSKAAGPFGSALFMAGKCLFRTFSFTKRGNGYRIRLDRYPKKTFIGERLWNDIREQNRRIEAERISAGQDRRSRRISFSGMRRVRADARTFFIESICIKKFLIHCFGAAAAAPFSCLKSV